MRVYTFNLIGDRKPLTLFTIEELNIINQIINSSGCDWYKCETTIPEYKEQVKILLLAHSLK